MTKPLDLSQKTISLSWDELTQRVARFLDAWERLDAPPPLHEFLPAEPAALRRMVLTELAKIDLEQRTARGLAARVDHYVEQFPELAENGEPPCDLIYEEFHVRRNAGETIQVEEYYRRFPKSADGLRRLLPNEPKATSAMGRKDQLESLAPDQEIDDFKLLARLGKGAFATVFLARQISLQRMVALKISADRGSETYTLAQLDHPNIVRVYDERRLLDRRLKLLYMQYAPGGTLDEVVTQVMEMPPAGRNGKLVGEAIRLAQARSGMLDDGAAAGRRFAYSTWPETVCRIGAQLAQALDYAHRQGILHRDVKPANVLLAADGTPKLADFNISFCSQLEGATPAAYFGGSLAYMSPEQLEACNPHHSRQPEELDGRSDLFSLAVLLWELLFGQRPFQDASVEAGWTATLEEMVKRRQTERPVAPKHLSEDELTKALSSVLLKALEPDVKNRYVDGAAMARDLQLCLQPRAQQLLTRPKIGVLKLLRSFPYPTMLLTILLPNAISGFFNQSFNWENLVGRYAAKDDNGHTLLHEDGSRQLTEEGERVDRAFYISMFSVNAVAFPFGIAIGTWLGWPMCVTVAKVNHGARPPPEELASARRMALRFGEYVAWLGAAEWLLAGIVHPSLICWLASVTIRPEVVGLFFSSLAVCGLIGAVFPYFGATWVGVRLFYPALLDGKPIEPAESALMSLVSARAFVYLLLAALVPLVGIFLIAYSGLSTPGFTLLLFIVGIGCVGLAWLAYQAIRSDIAALTLATRPLDTFGTGSESVEIG